MINSKINSSPNFFVTKPFSVIVKGYNCVIKGVPKINSWRRSLTKRKEVLKQCSLLQTCTFESLNLIFNLFSFAPPVRTSVVFSKYFVGIKPSWTQFWSATEFINAFKVILKVDHGVSLREVKRYFEGFYVVVMLRGTPKWVCERLGT